MANNQRAQLAEQIAKQADLNTNVVLRVIYALDSLGLRIEEVKQSADGQEVVRPRPQEGADVESAALKA